MPSAAQLLARFTFFFTKEIWKPAHLRSYSLRGCFYAVLRVLFITWTVFNETKAASRAAALSYSSLLGLGPLVAIAVLVAGFVLDSKDPAVVIDTMNSAIKYIAPHVSEYEAGVRDASAQAALSKLLTGFVTASRSGMAASVGGISLIFIVLMLFTSIENAFNEIWGVRRGRSWVLRIVFYWTIVTLGAVLFFAAMSMLGAGLGAGALKDKFPEYADLLSNLSWALPLGSVGLLILLLTLFYRFVPNTHVFWRAAFVGAVVVTVLIFANSKMGALYAAQVLRSSSLYGSLSLAVILMLGLYVFWLLVLIGGQVSYAVQNAYFRNSQASWGQLAEAMRERLSLVVLLSICRRFESCLQPCDASQLGDKIRVPTQIINECLNRLVNMGLVTPVPPAEGEAANNFRYQPARPASSLTLAEFKRLDDSYGDDPTGDTLSQLDPLLSHYDTQLEAGMKADFFNTPLNEILKAYPLPSPRNGGVEGLNG